MDCSSCSDLLMESCVAPDSRFLRPDAAERLAHGAEHAFELDNLNGGHGTKQDEKRQK